METRKLRLQTLENRQLLAADLLSIDAVETNASEVRIELSVGDGQAAAGNIGLSYDASVLRPLGANWHEGEAGRLDVVLGASGYQSVQFERISDLPANFRVVDTAAFDVVYRVQDAEDANRDGLITAVDALTVINALNRSDVDDPVLEARLDVNGDGQLSAVDALRVINTLNRQPAGGALASGEQESLVQLQSTNAKRLTHDLVFANEGSGSTSIFDSLGESGDGNDRHGDTFADATDVGLRNGAFSFTDRLETAGDVDVFRLPGGLPGAIVVSTRGGFVDIQLEVFDAEGNLIDNEAQGNFSGSLGYFRGMGSHQPASDSSIFVRVHSKSGYVGHYAIAGLFTGDVQSVPDDFDPSFDWSRGEINFDSPLGVDVHGDDFASATSSRHQVPAITVSNLDHPGDVDMFEFRVGRGYDFSVSLHSDEITAVDLQVFDGDGNLVVPDVMQSAAGVVGGNFHTPVNSLSDDVHDVPDYRTYFVRVASSSQETGRYALAKSSILSGGNVRFYGWLQIDDYLPYGSASDDDGSLRELQYTRTNFRTRTKDVIGIDQHGGDAASATAIDLTVPQELISSYFDQPGDQDAFRFTAKYSEMLVLASGTVEFTPINAQLLDSRGQEVSINPLSSNGRYDAWQANLNVGEEYVLIVSSEDDAITPYSLRLSPIGDVGSLFHADDATVLDLSDGTATISGTIENTEDVRVFQLTTRQPLMDLVNHGDPRIRIQVIAADGDGRILTPVLNHLDGLRLPGIADNAEHSFYVAVWSVVGRTEFDLGLSVYGRLETPATDDVGDELSDAKVIKLDQETRHDHGDYYAMYQGETNVQLNSAGDVDVYRVQAVGEKLTFVVGASKSPDFIALTVAVDVLDATGNQLQRVEIENREEIEKFLRRYGSQGASYDVTPGQDYFIRLRNTNENSMTVRLVASSIVVP